MNIFQVMQNPQHYAMNLMNQNPNLRNNPVISNAMQMAQSGNEKGLQILAQNLAKSKGIDINAILKQFRM